MLGDLDSNYPLILHGELHISFLGYDVVEISTHFCLFIFQGTPPSARHIPLSVLFGPLLLLQGLAVFFALLQSVERIYLLLNSEDVQGRYFSISSTARDFFGFLHRGSR